MADVYRSGRLIPELEGSVSGATTIICHQPSELLTLQAIGALADGRPNRRLEAVHALLTLVDFDRAAPMFQLSGAETLSGSTGNSPPIDQVDTLNAVLGMARDLWSRQENDVDDLRVAVLVADSHHRGYSFLRIRSEKPALVIHSGSVAGIIAASLRTLRVPLFAILFIRGRGVMPRHLTENLRDAIRTRMAVGSESLMQLKDITKVHVQNKKGIVLLLHGLLSSDLGTFDAFIKGWERGEELSVLSSREMADMRESFVFAGWPHDSLASIEENGRDLADEIQTRIGVNGPRIAFVCHSRGGLVARSAVQELVDLDPAWKKQLSGCVTFGTPHKGAALAESPGALVAVLLILGTLMQTRRSVSILEALELVSRRTRIKGIVDMRPAGKFLTKLVRREAKAKKKGFALDVFRVGGAAPTPGAYGWIADHALGGRKSDLVVEVESSLPEGLSQCHQTTCNHFDYLSVGEAKKRHFGKAVDYVRERTGYTLLRDEILGERLQQQVEMPRDGRPGAAKDRFKQQWD